MPAGDTEERLSPPGRAFFFYPNLYEGVPDDTFYLCDEHREVLSPGDDTVRVLTPAGVPVERELAVYACADDCPICRD